MQQQPHFAAAFFCIILLHNLYHAQPKSTSPCQGMRIAYPKTVRRCCTDAAAGCCSRTSSFNPMPYERGSAPCPCVFRGCRCCPIKQTVEHLPSFGSPALTCFSVGAHAAAHARCLLSLLRKQHCTSHHWLSSPGHPITYTSSWCVQLCLVDACRLLPQMLQLLLLLPPGRILTP